MEPTEQKPNKAEMYAQTKSEFVAAVKAAFGELSDEITERNQAIEERDNYIFGDGIEKSLDIPVGHDFTPVNWLRRTVEIHKNMFMGRGFTISSTYDTNDLSSAGDDTDRKRMEIENQKQKAYAESRMKLIQSIKEDNGGDSFWSVLAENASAVGDVAVKMYWDEDEKKIELCQIENIENLYALWNKDDFRDVDAYGYIYQVSKMEAISEFGAPDDVTTSPLGSPLSAIGQANNSGVVNGGASNQPMVTILEVTGKIQGWKTEKGKLKTCKVGQETEFNCLIVGNEVTRIIDDPKKLPKYYIFHNKTVRRRPWGLSDVTDAAILINMTYIETLSDWRTVASKVNFPKFKALGFGPDTQMPKYEARRVQLLPLSENQDLQELQQGDANGLDWGRQLDELQSQYVRESGVSRVLFDDPSVTLNSNQALTTSMKTTTDIAEAKKQLWAPIIKELFQDALELAAENMPDLKELVQPDDNWTLKIMWPSIMEKDDPSFQTMLLNRFNAGLMSAQSYLEAQGENKEELDRIREEMTDPITAAILSHQQPLVAQALINAATADIQRWYQLMMPQPQPAGAAGGGQTPGIDANGGGMAPAQVGTTDTNQPGQSPMSQAGTGATSASIGGALAQTQQNAGI